MSDIIMPRRRFLAGLVGLVAAPMVVRAAALMPVKMFDSEWVTLDFSGPGLVHATERILSGEMMMSAFDIPMFKDHWPNSMLTMIRHRRDLSDLGEPYLSMVKAQQERERRVRQS